ncbi:EamA family transporter [Halobacteriales archaeon QH_10_67_13]|nr:MAG: EamA family transporter [Halobacteriales archaeon QH_10_67_13]
MGAYRAAGLFVVLSMLWGTAFVAIKAGLSELPPVLFAALRYDLAGLLLIGYAAATTNRLIPDIRADWIAIGVGAVLLIAAYNALLFVGQQGVTSAVGAILVATAPILTTGFSRLLLPGEGLTPVGLVGLASGFAGVGLIAVPGESLGVDAVLAPGLIFLAAVSVALGSVLLERTEEALPIESTVAWSFLAGAVLLHLAAVALPTESIGDATVSREALLALAYLAVFASVVGYVIYFRLLDRLGAVDISLVSYAVPVSAAVAGWTVLGEKIDGLAVAGFLLILAGFVLIKRKALANRVAALGERGVDG